ncbi:TatD family hydrolase [Halobacteriovorax sp. GB3]|uniref:TatD family hydrolase n=1 Tax=Halobacteriovorax sp. GB3 TaxID=2719615 RepID=UPI00235FAB86|nr:TatD family hydrolase [Halobacteriovorax sp. GB3]MDD0853234.1 TatD family hydrolase [Halobacteriovorax sp. GB3]
MSLINFHTHSGNQTFEEGPEIHSLSWPEENHELLHEQGLFSLGIHPWSLGQKKIDWDEFERMILTIYERDNFFALGETGIDLVKKNHLKEQEKIFEKHIQLANKIRKPLIIHCVRAQNLIIKYSKKYINHTPWVLHDFNANEQMISDMVKRDFYFSLGPTILKETSKIRQNIRLVPIDRIFIETDDSNYSIKHMYNEMASLLKIDVNALASEIEKNFLRLKYFDEFTKS